MMLKIVIALIDAWMRTLILSKDCSRAIIRVNMHFLVHIKWIFPELPISICSQNSYISSFIYVLRMTHLETGTHKYLYYAAAKSEQYFIQYNSRKCKHFIHFKFSEEIIICADCEKCPCTLTTSLSQTQSIWGV